jgi:hypothetical protein
VAVDQLEGFGAGGVFGDGKHLRGHEVAHARGDVAEVVRERLGKRARMVSMRALELPQRAAT